MRVEHEKSGWKLVLDSAEIKPHDPGDGTPALVIGPDGQTGTYWCAFNEGEVDGQKIPSAIWRWLEDMLPVVDNFLLDNDQQAPVAGEVVFSEVLGLPDDDMDMIPTPALSGTIIHRGTHGGDRHG